MRERGLFVAALVIVGASTGALAGLEAGQTIDSFYTSERESRYHAEPATPATRWQEPRTYPLAPVPGTIWGQEIGRDERAFFDTGPALDTAPADDWREEPPVRVHRASVKIEEPAPVPTDAAEPDDPVDGWVDPPPAEPGAERLPKASLD